jgi:hypothetical protein
MLGLASFLAVLVVVALVVYGLDRLLGWGLMAQLLALWP